MQDVIFLTILTIKVHLFGFITTQEVSRPYDNQTSCLEEMTRIENKFVGYDVIRNNNKMKIADSNNHVVYLLTCKPKSN